MTGFVRTEGLQILRKKHYRIFQNVYQTAKELREDLKALHDSYTEPERKYIATFSVHDDLEAFVKATKEANRAVKESTGKYLIKYDDYLKTKGGQYALSKEMMSMMDAVSFDAYEAESKEC